MMRVLTYISATATASLTHLVQHVLDELDLVGDLGTTEDGQEWSLWALEHFGKVLELLLHEESSGSLGELDADHGRVRSVSGTKASIYVSNFHLVGNSRIVDVDGTELGELLSELLDGLWVGCLVSQSSMNVLTHP